eukprot:TRINITY_DN884_c0_g2_i3.p1 TRINITY_DN884_c0_g2~~TRINITY_DN884_c0_g2_i3.p1  ORF type:complete len:188 (+),score=12.73 TRINITY_DN884_c0_g2_i3:35-598(+)
MQEGHLNKLICHYCKRFLSLNLLVPCMIPGCGLFFCHKCLVSKCKYSRAKAMTLPTPRWKCPACGERCKCESCRHGGPRPGVRRGQAKYPRHVQYQGRKKSLTICGKRYSYLDFNAETPPSGGGTQELSSPKVKTVLPPISVFLSQVKVTSADKRENDRAPILPGSWYEVMSVGELLNIACIPITNY